MVKQQKHELPWKKPPTTNGVMQLRKYIDQCSDWMVEPVNTSDNSAIPVLASSHLLGSTDCDNIGLVEGELQHSKRFRCFTCDAQVCLGERGRVVVANPFTRAQFMLLCDSCKVS
jgi:hypothetical protein